MCGLIAGAGLSEPWRKSDNGERGLSCHDHSRVVVSCDAKDEQSEPLPHFRTSALPARVCKQGASHRWTIDLVVLNSADKQRCPFSISCMMSQICCHANVGRLALASGGPALRKCGAGLSSRSSFCPKTKTRTELANLRSSKIRTAKCTIIS